MNCRINSIDSQGSDYDLTCSPTIKHYRKKVYIEEKLRLFEMLYELTASFCVRHTWDSIDPFGEVKQVFKYMEGSQYTQMSGGLLGRGSVVV